MKQKQCSVVKIGDNKCRENGLCCQNGYSAIRGWDATTGVGTPNYDVLKEIVTAMSEAEIRAQNAAAEAELRAQNQAADQQIIDSLKATLESSHTKRKITNNLISLKF